MFSIEEANRSDLHAMAQLLQSLFEQEADFKPQIDLQIKALELIINHPKSGILFVAKSEDKTIGMVSLLYTISTAMGGKVAILEDMVVNSEYRNQGIGKALLHHASAYAFKNNCLRLTLLTDLDNTTAHQFYQNRGFKMSAMVPFRLLP